MSCDRTEYRLLLHAHGALNPWERWQVERHLRSCSGCREQRQRFGVERRALASCLVTPPMSRVSDRVAMQLGVVRPPVGPRLVLPRRLSALVLLLVAVTSAAAAVAFVQWRQSGESPVAFWQQQFARPTPTVFAPCEAPPCDGTPAPQGSGCGGAAPGQPMGLPEPLGAAKPAAAAATKQPSPKPALR